LSKNHGGIGGEEELSRCNNGGETKVEEEVPSEREKGGLKGDPQKICPLEAALGWEGEAGGTGQVGPVLPAMVEQRGE
jgi:hypothetical protein